MFALMILVVCGGSLHAQDKVYYYDPVWSADGKIAFYSNLNGNYDIYLVNKDGTGLKQITSHEATDSSPSFTADGKKILFTSKRDGNSEVYSYDRESKKLTRITNTPSNESSPRISSNGEWIVFESRADGHRDVFIARADGTEVTNLTNQEANDFRPIWSNNGQLIYFQSKRSGYYQLYSMKPDGSEVTLLNKTDHHQTSPAPFFNANKLAYAQYSDKGVNIHVLDLDTKRVEEITDGYGDIFLPSFSPDGKEIVFAITEANGNSSEIYIMDYDTREIRKLFK